MPGRWPVAGDCAGGQGKPARTDARPQGYGYEPSRVSSGLAHVSSRRQPDALEVFSIQAGLPSWPRPATIAGRSSAIISCSGGLQAFSRAQLPLPGGRRRGQRRKRGQAGCSKNQPVPFSVPVPFPSLSPFPSLFRPLFRLSILLPYVICARINSQYGDVSNAPCMPSSIKRPHQHTGDAQSADGVFLMKHLR